MTDTTKNDQDIQVFEIPRPTEAEIRHIVDALKQQPIDMQKRFANANGSLPVSSGQKTLHRAPPSSGTPRIIIAGPPSMGKTQTAQNSHTSGAGSGLAIQTQKIGGAYPLPSSLILFEGINRSPTIRTRAMPSADVERFLEKYKTLLSGDFKFSSEPDYQDATANVATGREENFSRAGDQARFEAIGALLADDAAKIAASCVKPVEKLLTPEEKQKRLNDAAHAATHACAFMDYKT